MIKNILVLGSSGFIGGHLVKTLKDEGHNVTGADVRDIQYEIFTPTKFIKGDLREINFVKSLFETEYDEVYQLAADMGGAIYINSGEHDGLVMSNSALINCNIIKSILNNVSNVKKFFFASSACVYPNTDNIATCNEEDSYPAFPDNEYGWEKLFSERMYKAVQKQFGLKVYIARFHSIVGDYAVWETDRSKAHSALAYKVAKTEENGIVEVIGDGEQLRCFLYVSDCIRGIRSLLEHDVKEVVNIGSDEFITINQYVNLLKNISGKNFNIKYIDGPTGVKTRYCNIDKIKKLTGWKPEVSVEESSRLTYEFINDCIKPVVGYISQSNGYSNGVDTAFCGIALRGKLTCDILKSQKSKKYKFIPGFIRSQEELEQFILKQKPTIMLYNYHFITTGWLTDVSVRAKYPHIKHVLITHDLQQYKVDNYGPQYFNDFKYILSDDETISNKGKKNVFTVARSIPFHKNIVIDENRKDEIPIIGFQGFGPPHKGIPRLAQQIQNEFDEAIFRLHIPYSYYGDPQGNDARARVQEVKNIITKPGIKIESSHDLKSDEDIVKWLNENTINCYLYDYLEGSGISSCTDYAIAAYRPIAINNSRMFVNLHNLEPSIEIEKNSIKDIINNGIKPLYPIYERYQNKNVLKDYEYMCDCLLSEDI